MNWDNMTTSQGLVLMNRYVRVLRPDASKGVRKLRAHLVRKWLRQGGPISYAPNRVANPVTQGIRVSPNMLLTDSPRLFAAIAAGAVPGYVAADEAHPADQWVIQVNGVWRLTPDSQIARDLYEWQLEHKKTEAK
ncbi:hypothetical protein [Lacticaseibacillus daqingensis]|uniref:hypothetical protein n=1 Tax=Lacticaseibacillus daqingensis TaxID=2486014 RepID=UPI001CDC2094|nr:hypothetical protein [Lacticaseibacillus daqingensis]